MLNCTIFFSKMKGVFSVLALFLLCNPGDAFMSTYRLRHQQKPELPPNDSTEPLFLTPFIEAGKITEGQKRSRVYLNGTDVVTHSGLITVNKEYDSNMFFMFHEAENRDLDAPMIIWLQGGPGASSLYGMFAELGPYYVGEDMNLIPRHYSWSSTFSALFIDSPVGTGFSFTKDDKGYATTQNDVGRDLYEFLLQFYKLFPHMAKNELYVTGESYAGKYVPTLTHYIYQKNKEADFKINIKGMAVGNGGSDPSTMTNYGDYLYQLGLLDLQGRKKIKEEEKIIKELYKNKEYLKGVEAENIEMNDMMQMTGLTNYFNYLEPPANISERFWQKYVTQKQIREAIHVADTPFGKDGNTVYFKLREDQGRNVRDVVTNLLNSPLKVLYYNGQLDIIVAYPLTEAFLHSLDGWKNIEAYKNSTRKIWRVDGEVAGYEKKIGNFQQVLVRNCGHMVPMDQPKWGFDMLYRFIYGKPF